MKKLAIIAATAFLMLPATGHACMTIDRMVSIYPVSDTPPDKFGEGVLGNVYKIRYDGVRAGDQNKLSNNFYVVEILDGKYAGKKARIPEHVTSCHSVVIPDGVTGYVQGALNLADRDGKIYDVPILSTWMNGRRVAIGDIFRQGSAN